MRLLPQLWVILAALVSSKSLPTCDICFLVGGDGRDQTASAACSSSSQDRNGTASMQTFNDLQPALEMISRLEKDSESTPEGSETEGCFTVSIYGNHLITAPIDFGSNSVVFAGGGSDPPTIQCNISAVDYDRLLDPDYQDYAMRFLGSERVSFVDVNFVGCSLPLRLERVRTVTVHSSTFQGFSEAVFDIYNCPNVTITDSSFLNNKGTGISRTPFRANTGAVAISMNGVDTDLPSPTFVVARCNFINNRATALASVRSSTTTFFRAIFTGRGGGLGVFINEYFHNVTGMVTDNRFVGNYARSFGAGLYMVIFGEGTQATLLVERNVFVNNLARIGGGGMLMTFFSFGLESAPHQTNITDCEFIGNSAETGGGILVGEVDGFSFFKLERCNFSCNRGVGSTYDFGSAFSTWVVNHLRDRQSIPQNQFVDCIFEDNDGDNGIVNIGYVPMGFLGRNYFRRNTGTSSLRIIGSVIDFHGYVEFTENIAFSTTAVELLSFGQIRFNSDLRVNFTRNTGRFGSCISSSTAIISNAFQKVAFNPQCFILYENPVVPPLQWNNVSISFHGNEAVLASALYVSTVQTCSWFSSSYPFFDSTNIRTWPAWDFGNDSRNTGYRDLFSPEYHVQTSPQILETELTQVSAWPGQKFNIQLTAWDEFRTQTSASGRYDFHHYADPSLVVRFQPEVVVIDSDGEDSTLGNVFLVTYAPSNVSALSVDEPIGNVNIEVLFEVNRVTGDNFTLISELCPGGFELVLSSTVQCQCKESETQVLNCEDDQDSIIIQRGLWASTVPSRELYRHSLSLHVCPAGFCRCFLNSSLGEGNCVSKFVNSDPDAQCACTRKGVLCGDCKNGFGVSALFHNCVTCSNASILIILLLVVVDAAVLITILLVDVWVPPVLYAFLFYIQTIPFASLYFPETFQVTGQYLYFISSVLSFYLPYDFCLSRQLSPILAYFIRLVPALIAILVTVPLFIILRHKKWKHKYKHRGVWLIIVFLYTHSVYSSLAVLNCSYIPEHGDETSRKLRWFVSGSIECFSGGHAPLAVLAIVILIISLSLIPLVACIAIGIAPKRIQWMWSFQQPLVESFKRQYRWWPAVELARRFIAIVLIIFLPRAQVYLLLFICVIVVLYGYVQPYQSLIANYIETVVELNFFLLLLLVSSQVLEQFHDIPITNGGFSNYSNSSDCADGNNMGVATVTWILTPLYYLPLLLLAGLVIIYTILLLRKRYCSPQADDKESLGDTLLRTFAQPTTTQDFIFSEVQYSRDRESPLENESTREEETRFSWAFRSWQTTGTNSTLQRYSNFSQNQSLLRDSTVGLLAKSDIH